MKKIVPLFLGSIFTLSLLVGCSNEPDLIMPMVQQPANQVNVLSDKGLADVNKAIGKYYFDNLDKNKDGNITPEEYKALNLPDADKRFKKVDKDADNKITLQEMIMSRKNFLPENFSKDNLRKQTKTAFEGVDTNKDTFLTLDDVSLVNSDGQPNSMVGTLKIIIALADVNEDGKLDFSEYEDVAYKIMKGTLKPVTPAPVPTTPDTPPVQNPVDAPQQPAPDAGQA